ncbi:MAG TPA: magnesium transporter [Candidatus Binatia bacterium]|jgi:magnesium transporter|nr:magnesium transporter [Candidatus Binatia bacterium]
MVLRPVFSFKEFGTRVSDVLLRRNDAALRELIAKAGDEELASVIDPMAGDEKVRTLRALPAERRAKIMGELSEYSQETVLRLLKKEDLAAMIGAAESDDAVDVIQLLDDAARARIVGELRRHDPNGLLPLLAYGEETAGGIMKTELARFRATMTVDEARRQLANAPAKRVSQQIYVVDEQDALVGTIAPLKLLQAPTAAALAEAMQPAPASLPSTMDQEEVARQFDEQNAIELPVVGPKGKLIGIITADDVFEVMEKEYSEDISRLAGVDEDDHVSDPVLRTVSRRLPWLIVNLGTAILAASVVGLFQGTIQKVVILAAYMPIIAGMGGNAATQTLGVVIRALALGELHELNTLRTVAAQTIAGSLNGLANGVIMGGIAYAWAHDAKLAVVIMVAMTVNMFIAGLGGAIIPVVMKRLRIDPALASAVFVTTLTDCCGFFVFLGLATVFLT